MLRGVRHSRFILASEKSRPLLHFPPLWRFVIMLGQELGLVRALPGGKPEFLQQPAARAWWHLQTQHRV